MIKYRALNSLKSYYSSSKFIHLLSQNNEQSLQKAADMLVSITAQQKSLKNKITTSKQYIENYKRGNNQQLIKQLTLKLTQVQNQNKLVYDRIRKQIQTVDKYTLTRMAKEVLDVSDTLNKCVKEMTTQPNQELNIVLSMLYDVFSSVGIRQFDPTGQVFDPNSSQAVGQTIDETQKSGNVAQTIQTGFRIHDRLLRAAKVSVVK